MTEQFEIRQAGFDCLAQLAPLFDAYRQFYGQASNEAAVERFLTERFEQQDSVVFLACRGTEAAGFAQLYPSFSSVALRRLWVLNDLFVRHEDRRLHVAEKLIERAIAFARSTGACRLTLATGCENLAAQRLYAKLGWLQDDAFMHFNYAL
jgi:GNAT superfamily N-acetyltransferase